MPESLLAARIRENEAQRQYEWRAALVPGGLTLITLTVTIITGLFVFLDAQVDQRQGWAETEARMWETRVDQYTEACGDAQRNVVVRATYCTSAADARQAVNTYRDLAQQWNEVNHTSWKTTGLLVSIGVTSAMVLFLWLRIAAIKLHVAQGYRMVLEEANRLADDDALLDKDRRHRLLSRRIAGRR